MNRGIWEALSSRRDSELCLVLLRRSRRAVARRAQDLASQAKDLIPRSWEDKETGMLTNE